MRADGQILDLSRGSMKDLSASEIYGVSQDELTRETGTFNLQQTPGVCANNLITFLFLAEHISNVKSYLFLYDNASEKSLMFFGFLPCV